MAVLFGSGVTVVTGIGYWTSFKTMVNAKKLLVQYEDDGTRLTIFAFDGPALVYAATIYDGTVPDGIAVQYSQATNDSDKSDFNTNFQPTANKPFGGNSTSQGATTSDQTGQLTLGGVTTAAPTYTTGQSQPLSLTTAGALRTDSVVTVLSVGTTGAAVPSSATLTGGKDGSGNLQPIKVSATGVLSVDGSATAQPVTDNSGSLTVDNGGTFAVQDSEKLADNAAFTDGTTKVMPGGYIFDEVAGTALTENDVAAARVDSKRAQVLVLEDATTRGQRAAVSAGGAVKVDGSAATQPVSGSVTAVPFAALSSAIDGVATLTATGDNAIIAAQGGLVRIYVTSFSASNTSSTGVRIDFKDGSTVKHSFYLAPTGGGVSHIFPFPWRLTANTALNVAISAAVTDVRVSVTGFTT